MKIYKYHPITKIFLGEGEARHDPEELRLRREKAGNAVPRKPKQTQEEWLAAAAKAADTVKPEHWLIPASTTTIEPPTNKSNEFLVFQEDRWIKVKKPTPDEVAAQVVKT